MSDHQGHKKDGEPMVPMVTVIKESGITFGTPAESAHLVAGKGDKVIPAGEVSAKDALEELN